MTLRRTRMRAIPDKRLQALGYMPSNTLTSRNPMAVKRSDTGPKCSARDAVHERSGGLCEFVWCPCRAEQMHHRRPRRMGGSSAADTNDSSNLVDLCSAHHAWVESNRLDAIAMGLILPAGAVPAQVSVLLRHDPEPVFLTPAGTWVRFEEACA